MLVPRFRGDDDGAPALSVWVNHSVTWHKSLVISPIIYAEISVRFQRIEDLTDT